MNAPSRTARTVAEVRAAVAEARRAGHRIAFVPTMGNLHAGHRALVERARELARFVVVSIFVNPLQFGVGEDLDAYPRTPEADQRLLQAAGAALVWSPGTADLYPRGLGETTRVEVPVLSDLLCGAHRPGHFAGVATVVTILLNAVAPDVALFGEKDFQQLAVIRTLVRDLNMPIQIIGEPTVRAEDGLALSSRNGYLSAEQRAAAPALYRTLQQLASAIRDGNRDFAQLIEAGQASLVSAGFRPDYLEIREASSLRPAEANDTQLVILGAAFMGTTRLIDNLAFQL